jgi:ABC-type polysaccharide/polyol phosphate transport system ATPase subunit
MLLRDRLKHLLRPHVRERFYVLRDVSFAVESGESLGIIGHNGAGKSTLLNVATSLCSPDEGKVTINGRVAALLELGSGFHPDLTGAENVRINAALLGLTRREARERFDEIVGFSELGEFIDEPLRTYSSGMMMRLAFSVAISVSPDILIIDEVLGVGDQSFSAKCSERILELRRSSKSMIVVSHSPEMLERFCNRGLWLDHGRVVKTGRIREVLDAYLQHAPEQSAAVGR